ncbi:MAG: DUF2892 domain-containing protein [Pseudomonadota bacterium]
MNVGVNDGFIRLFIGSMLLVSVFFGPQISWGWIGLVGIMTGLFRRCPIYFLAGINTQRK